jgi:hypothetical protein
MPNPFSITAATDTIPLDAQGRGSITYTVSNISGQPLRGRARLVPSDPGHISWLSVEGDPERSFAPDGTHQYTVRVASPPGTAPGRHTFGFNMISLENPDEVWSQGPQVAFEIPATPSANKPFPWWILAVILGLLLVVGLVAWLSQEEDPVPVAGPETPTEPVSQKAGLLEGCTQEADCAEGLGCATDAPGQPGRCRGKEGFEPCSLHSDCQEGLICDDQVCRADEGTRQCYFVTATVGGKNFRHHYCFYFKQNQPGCEITHQDLGDETLPPQEITVRECTRSHATFIGRRPDGYWHEAQLDFEALTGKFQDSLNQQGTVTISLVPESM